MWDEQPRLFAHIEAHARAGTEQYQLGAGAPPAEPEPEIRRVRAASPEGLVALAGL